MSLPNESECVLGLTLDRHATQRPHEVMAVFEDGGTWTWAQAREAVRVTAGALRAHGVRAELPKTPTAKVRKHLLKSEGVTVGCYDREQHGFQVTREQLTGS